MRRIKVLLAHTWFLLVLFMFILHLKKPKGQNVLPLVYNLGGRAKICKNITMYTLRRALRMVSSDTLSMHSVFIAHPSLLGLQTKTRIYSNSSTSFCSSPITWRYPRAVTGLCMLFTSAPGYGTWTRGITGVAHLLELHPIAVVSPRYHISPVSPTSDQWQQILHPHN